MIGSDSTHALDSHGLIFEDATAFSQYIERRAINEKVPCMTLILDFCKRRSLDVDDITDLISKPLKEKVKKEMIESGLMRQTDATLDGIDG